VATNRAVGEAALQRRTLNSWRGAGDQPGGGYCVQVALAGFEMAASCRCKGSAEDVGLHVAATLSSGCLRLWV
jgi:hypothetical protein